MDDFPLVPEHDKGLLQEDEMLAFANHLLQPSSAPGELHGQAAGQQLSMLTDLSCDTGPCDNGLQLETLHTSFPIIQAPGSSAPERMTVTAPQLFQISGQTILPFGQAAYFLPQGHSLPNLHVSPIPLCPSLAGASSAQPFAGQVRNMSQVPGLTGGSDGTGSFMVDLNTARLGAGMAASGGQGVQNVTVQTQNGQFIQAQIIQPMLAAPPQVTQPALKKFKASPVSQPGVIPNALAAPLSLNVSGPPWLAPSHQGAQMPPPGTPVLQSGKGPSSTLERFQLVAHELYGQITDAQKSQLNHLHQQAKDSKDPAAADAATKKFWQKWYDFAPAQKVNEFRQLMNKVMGKGAGGELDTSMQMPVSRQDSNHSTNDGKDGKQDLNMDYHQDTADTMIVAQEKRVEGVDILVKALQEYDRSYNQRLVKIEGIVKQLEVNLCQETAARVKAEKENARLADEVKRLHGALLQLQQKGV